MIQPFALSLVLGLSMIGSAGLTKLLTPNVFLSSTRPAQELKSLIPIKFGAWQEEKNIVSAIVTPEIEAALNKIYTETLSRTYINDKGDRIMLSIAYGKDQRDTNAVHYPEVCYPAQGFQVKSATRSKIVTSIGDIPVKRLETNLSNQRYEPVTYWTTVGDMVVTGPIEKKLKEMKFGLRREIPDGLIFRVSSIDYDTSHAFITQDSFVAALIVELNPSGRKRLAGID